MPEKRPLMLVEDDRVDAMTVKRAVEDAGIHRDIVHLLDGEEALDYLRSDINEKPCLILLDLNMPRMNGLEFLRVVKQDPDLSLIPVIVLTTSTDIQDVDQSFQWSVAGYLTKTVEYPVFVEKISAIKAYWAINRTPGDEWEVSHAG